MPIFALLGIAVLFAGAWWYDKKREAEMVARLENLRKDPAAASALVDGLIAQRKRETEDKVRGLKPTSKLTAYSC